MFQVVLGQTVVSRLPDVVRLGSEAEAATDEMRRLLLLVLGCAVQCSCKQQVVDNIKLMDYQTQHAIVECIQQVSRPASSDDLIDGLDYGMTRPIAL